VLWLRMVELESGGIQTTLSRFPPRVVGKHPQGDSRIPLLILCRFVPICLESMFLVAEEGLLIQVYVWI
jgi:hypothetical protein